MYISINMNMWINNSIGVKANMAWVAIGSIFSTSSTSISEYLLYIG